MSKKEVKSKVGEKSSIYDEKSLNYNYVEEVMKNLSGKILTIIDGAITEERQNKAIKDQVKKEIWYSINTLQFSAYGGRQGHSVKL